MKRMLTLMCGILMISSVAQACGGITVKGKYCLSKHKMNWYSAYAWCKDQSKNLIDVNTVCGTNVSACSELKLSSDEQNNITANGGQVGTVWTGTSYSASHAFLVTLSSGQVGGGPYSRNNPYYYALCH